MEDEIQLGEGQVLTGSSFSEPMLVETVRENGSGVWVVGMVGQRSERFRRVTLTAEDISGLLIADAVIMHLTHGCGGCRMRHEKTGEATGKRRLASVRVGGSRHFDSGTVAAVRDRSLARIVPFRNRSAYGV